MPSAAATDRPILYFVFFWISFVFMQYFSPKKCRGNLKRQALSLREIIGQTSWRARCLHDTLVSQVMNNE
jgi:hypothetical protein